MSKTRTYAVVTPHELYRCVLGMGWKISNTGYSGVYEIHSESLGIKLKLSSGVYEDDYVVMECCDE